MKILLINPPKEKEFTLSVLDDYNTKARSNQPPLGLLYLYLFSTYLLFGWCVLPYICFSISYLVFLYAFLAGRFVWE